MKRAIPSVITLAGLALGLLGVVERSSLLLLASLLLDVLDGATARRLGAVTRFGAALDLVSDQAIAVGIACVLLPRVAAPGIVIGVAILAAGTASGLWARRVSGRALLTVLAVVFAASGLS